MTKKQYDERYTIKETRRVWPAIWSAGPTGTARMNPLPRPDAPSETLNDDAPI